MHELTEINNGLYWTHAHTHTHTHIYIYIYIYIYMSGSHKKCPCIKSYLS